MNTDISIVSAAMHLKCGRIFNDVFTANLTVSLSIKKKFQNQLAFGKVTGKSLVSCFLTHSVINIHSLTQSAYSEPCLFWTQQWVTGYHSALFRLLLSVYFIIVFSSAE